jgi:hypothetical protein
VYRQWLARVTHIWCHFGAGSANRAVRDLMPHSSVILSE